MSKTKVKQHDALVKKFLTNLDTALDFLQIHLPAEIKNICDLSSLTIESGSYLEDDLMI